MNSLRVLAGSVLLCTALVAGPAAAWNAKGHMMVAAVAWRDMSPAARARATDLLKLNPNYAKWTANITASQRDVVAFVRAATWPDEIRSDPGYADDGSRPPNGPTASQNIGYADHLLHRYWHFKDLPFSPDGTPTEAAEAPNAATQITVFAVALASPQASDDVKSYDLSWLLHLVGDVHQPLHATSRFTASGPNGDNGGNSVHVCLPNAAQCDSQHFGKLHAFWDGALGNTTNATVAINAAHALGAPAGDANVTDVDAWLQESLQLAQSSAYAAPIGGGKGPYRLTDRYRRDTERAARERIALAGARLAKILNAALP